MKRLLIVAVLLLAGCNESGRYVVGPDKGDTVLDTQTGCVYVMQQGSYDEALKGYAFVLLPVVKDRCGK